jgi:hypothetical protein
MSEQGEGTASDRLSDDGILKLLKRTSDKASLANVKEARRLESAGTPHAKPVEPERPNPLPRYMSVYLPAIAAGESKEKSSQTAARRYAAVITQCW